MARQQQQQQTHGGDKRKSELGSPFPAAQANLAGTFCQHALPKIGRQSDLRNGVTNQLMFRKNRIRQLTGEIIHILAIQRRDCGALADKWFETALQLFHRITVSAGHCILRQIQGFGNFCKCQFFPVFQDDHFILRGG